MMNCLLLSMRKLFSPTLYTVMALLGTLFLPHQGGAQSQDLTVVVLVNSSNTTDYNINPATPGTYQMGPERYLVHLQVPYRVIDVRTTPAPDLSTVQLIVAGHARLSLGVDWQNAIETAVFNGTGFVNLDSDPNIGQQLHIQKLFSATGSTVGGNQTSIVVPAAVQVGGATPHYIAALQRHWAGDPSGDLIYPYHGNGTVVIPSNATVLTTKTGVVVAELGTDPLILATTYGKGRAVDFTTYDYLHADRFGFVEGVDDLFWRSIVWAARKPFVLRGYPRSSAIQLDDNEPGIMSRIPDLWNTTLTGQTASDGTGGPWHLQVNMQLSSLADSGGERAQMISAIQSNLVHASPHGLNYGSGGDLYWNLTVPNTDAQWQANVASTLQWKAGQGGSDTFPTFSRSMVAHYWDISSNSGYEMWHSLGLRYVTSPQAPGAYYFTVPKTPAQRIPLGPFRIYEQPPLYSGDEEETFPFFFADDLSIGSVAGKPAQTFFAFASQVGTEAGRFSRPDAVFPSSQNSYTVAQSLNQWEYYMWRFWSGMAPVQIYTHDGSNLEFTTASDRQSFITQLSQWFSTNRGQHVFMDTMGDYLRARNHSLLATASLNNSALTLNFTGSATDADGKLIDTKAYVFYGDDEGTLLDVPGFSNGATYSFANTQPAALQLDPLALSFATVPGTSPAAQTMSIGNVGSGSFTWTASSNAAWLTTSPASGSSNTTAMVTANSSSLSAGNYTGALTFTAAGALNSPQTIPVSLKVSAPALLPTPASLTFSATAGGAAPTTSTITITNPSGSNLGWTATSSASWLNVATGTAGTPGSLIVSVAPGNLALGVYTASITLTPTSGTAAAVSIPVTLQLSGSIDAPSTANLTAWTFSPLGNTAGWTSSGGSIHYNGGGESQLYAGSPLWTDYDVNVTLALSNLSDYPGGIRARVNPANGSGYALWMYPAEHTLTLYSVTNWNIDSGYTTLATASNITFNTTAHTLRLSVHGNQISAAYDGTQVLSVTDNSYTAGEIALDPSTQPIAYSSVVVSSSSNQATVFSASPTSLSFSAAPGAASPTTQTVSLSSTPTGLSWTASSSVPWLTASPAVGATTPATTSISATAAGLAAGTYAGTLTFTPSSGSPVQVAVTLTVAAAGTVIFSDTFASGSAQWTPSPLGLASNWSVANNTFHYNGQGHTQQYAGSQSWTNYTVSTGITLSNLSNYPGGLRGRVNLTTGAAYVAWLYPADHVIKLFRTAGWNIDTSGLTLLGQSSTIAMDTNLHTLRLGFSGSQITVYYDTTQIITATDSTLTSGAIALDVSSQPVSFSNVNVLQ
jgi:Viral BACON domain